MGIIGLVAATMAAATVWLLLTDPVTVADSACHRATSPPPCRPSARSSSTPSRASLNICSFVGFPQSLHPLLVRQ